MFWRVLAGVARSLISTSLQGFVVDQNREVLQMETDKPAIDVNLRFVRVIERRADGLIEFEFAIGEPDLCVEMLMPVDAFDAFCSDNEAILLPRRDDIADPDWGWSLHQATHQRFR